MQWQKLTAIVRSDALERIERSLQDLGVRGISVTAVKGYGEYADFFRRDWLVRHARIEVFTDLERAQRIAEAIMTVAHTGSEGDGLVAILPVQQIYRIRECRPCEPGEL